MKEHFKNQTSIEKIYDDEISRQRMALEEKLARRRALAEANVSRVKSPCVASCYLIVSNKETLFASSVWLCIN